MRGYLRTGAVILLCMVLCLSGCGFSAELVYRADPWENGITWQQGFRTKFVPEGKTNERLVAYASKNGDETVVENVPLETAVSFDDNGFVPRERFFLDKYDPCLEPVVHCISYAAVHCCDRFVMPVDEQTYAALRKQDRNFFSSLMWSFSHTCARTVTDAEGNQIYYVLFSVTPLYYQDSAESTRLQALAHTAALELVAAMPADCDTDYEKVLYFYSWLTEHVEYNRNDYYETFENIYYDTLVNRSTVCSGFAWTLSWLCDLAELECVTVTGQSDATTAHAWNIIRVDDTYYWFDSTWDAGYPPEEYAFFGVSDAVMEYCGYHGTYQYYTEILPSCPENLRLPNGKRVVWEYILQ